jgi:hypothetical protein
LATDKAWSSESAPAYAPLLSAKAINKHTARCYGESQFSCGRVQTSLNKLLENATTIGWDIQKFNQYCMV